MFVSSLLDPAENAAVITKSDTVNLLVPSRFIIVGVSGNISVEMVGIGTTSPNPTVIIPVVAGVVYPIRCNRINSTNTTATGLVALW